MTVEASRSGKKLIQEMQRATRRRIELGEEFRAASEREDAAKRAIAEWILPADAKYGERIAIWDRDEFDRECLIQVTPYGDNPPSIEFRYRK
ncbi:hypothetical protein [Bradyrhizobium sp. SZCCHNS3053]|uniref:hypothetical protein n=1 Tax=Bradyrhizobium sp. SZCCHNS3053 TaxID=3057322 RepID=UPI0029168FF8|nr:hypothetical protein [Bradyrhizobium sp. SZCCHNS3053]